MIPLDKRWFIDALMLQLEVTLPEPGSFMTEEERELNHRCWFEVTCLLRYPEPYYADELIETVLDIHEAVTGRRYELHGDTHDDYVWDRIYSDMEFAAHSGAFRMKEWKAEPLPVLDEIPEINYTPQPIVPERLTFIGVKIMDQDDEFVVNSRVRVKLPDGDIKEGRTNSEGEVMIKGFALDGMAQIELLDFVEALDGEAPEEEEEAAPPVEEVPTEDEKEFSVKVVDETGKAVPDVGVNFAHDGTSELVKTDGGGVAKYKAATDSVKVTFESAEAVHESMQSVWESRPATAIVEYLKPSDDIVAVASRASAIETAEGRAFDGLSLEAAKLKTISIRPAPRRATLVEMHDTLFRTNSAVVLPEGEAPAAKVGEHESLTTVGLIATILRYNEEHEGKKLFVAGHTDRAGAEELNDKLSEERAKAVLALLEGKRDAFIAACTAKNSEVDVTQIFDWSRNQYGFACKPTVMDRPPSDENYVKFRSSYNKWIDNGPIEGESEPRGTKIGQYGRLQPDIWGAVYDMYEYELKAELGEDSGGVATLRSKLTWVDDSRKSLGFSEHHPVDANRPDGMRSQEDRRVEVLMFDEGEEPDLGATNGEEIYDGVTYEKKHLEPMASAKPHKCLRIAVPIGDSDDERNELTLQVVGGQTYAAKDGLERDGLIVFELNPLLLPNPCSLRLTFWGERTLLSNSFDPLVVYAALRAEDVDGTGEVWFEGETTSGAT